jgi:hypothetical protein
MNFDKLYDMTDDDVKKGKKPVVRRKIERAFQSAIDQCTDAVIDIDEKISIDLRELAGGSIDRIETITKLMLKKDAQVENKKLIELLSDLLFDAPKA